MILYAPNTVIKAFVVRSPAPTQNTTEDNISIRRPIRARLSRPQLEVMHPSRRKMEHTS